MTGTSNQAASRTLGRWPKSNRKMGIGFMLPIGERSAFGRSPVRFAEMVQMAQAAEAAGFDALWLADHFLFRHPVAPEGEEYGVWEAWTAAAALAQATTKINIGLLVTCLGWRNPGMVARMTDTIDEISQGRFILGVGAGWHEPEYTAYGFPFDYRVTRFEDSMIILDQLLGTGRANHDGPFFQAQDAISQPRGPLAATGGSPILVGTSGERMMRLTARYADAWNTVWHKEVSAASGNIESIKRACDLEGRDPGTLVLTAGGNVKRPGYLGIRANAMEGSDEQIAENLISFRDAGFRHFVAGPDPCTPESLAGFGDVLKLVDRG